LRAPEGLVNSKRCGQNSRGLSVRGQSFPQIRGIFALSYPQKIADFFLCQTLTLDAILVFLTLTLFGLLA
jgi:hypothetical protein